MRIIFAGGGTGGHIYPAVAIAKEIIERDKDVEVLFVGTEKGLENTIIPMEGFQFKKIKVRGFSRKINFENVIAVKEVLLSFIDAYKIIGDFKPDIVVGTGGYVCGSLLLTASLMGIPTLIHEQNAFPGITNRILSRFVDKIALTFPEASRYLPQREKIRVTGNPLRSDITKISSIDGKSAFSFDINIPLILIAGGSRGAKKINESSLILAKECLDKKQYQILHMTGETQYDDVLKAYGDLGISFDTTYLKVMPYIHNMSYALAAADLIISRCGAGLISEITALGKPSILIPYPYAADNHQEYNARALEKSGAANVILERDLNQQMLLSEVKNLFQNYNYMEEMAMQSKKLGKPNATVEIVEMINELLKRKNEKVYSSVEK